MAEITRRLLLKLAGCGGASALAAGTGVKNAQSLIPLMIPPTEEFKPGQWINYATTCRECPAGCGMHVRCTDGRVQKCEGNPDHEINRGGLCPRGQSAPQGLYDPDRLRSPHRRSPAGKPEPIDLEQAIKAIADRLAWPSARLIVVSDLQTGATAEILRSFAAAFGSDRVHFYEPFNYEALRQANRLVLGNGTIPRYRLDKAPYIVSFAADFLDTWLSPVEFARQFASRARDARMVYAGPRLSMTAGNADTFIQANGRQTLCLALAMLRKMLDLTAEGRKMIGLKPTLDNILDGLAVHTTATVGSQIVAVTPQGVPVDDAAVTAMAKAFVEAPGSVALAGPVGHNEIVARDTAIAATLMNLLAGRIGQTVDFSQPHALSATATDEQVDQLLKGLGEDDVLVVHNANLAYSHRAGKDIRKAGAVVYLGQMMDETALLADWVLPIDSPLEAWGDYEPYAGVHCLSQPAMVRLHASCLVGDMLLAVAEQAGKEVAPAKDAKAPDFEGWLEYRWRGLHKRLGGTDDFETFWTDVLRRGGIVEPTQPVTLSLQTNVYRWQPALPPEPHCELWPWASIMLFDGKAANRGWLQEAPDPISTAVWASYLELNPHDAAALGLKTNDVARVLDDRTAVAECPVYVTSDIAPGMVGLAFGQGHTALGRNARGVGVNAFELAGRSRLAIQPAGRSETVAFLSDTQEQMGRNILQWARPDDPEHPVGGGEEHERYVLPLPEGYSTRSDLYPAPKYKQYRWGMVIDLERCIGCGACAVACYAENNVAVMGAKQCAAGREMAWLKVTPYRHPGDQRRVGWLPILCQHCDSAPCEPVCPVFAAVHNEEGLNAQVYNRCIGTRYCSNNCPYKVRRFNWVNIDWPTPLDWQLNPQVSVRARGVMEKCTFCIQRIRQGQLSARRQGRRKLADGEVVPACAQSCPTRAILFGNVLDEDSQVGQLTRKDPRRYHVLADLNTKPAIAYLRRLQRD